MFEVIYTISLLLRIYLDMPAFNATIHVRAHLTKLKKYVIFICSFHTKPTEGSYIPYKKG